jgi:hypothetical protein
LCGADGLADHDAMRSALLASSCAFALCTAAAGGAAAHDVPRSPDPWYLNATLFPTLDMQQVEGPERDDLLVSDWGVTSSLSLTYSVLPWLEPGFHYQSDGGHTRHARFSRPDAATGATSETDLVEGTYWEQWFTLFARGRFDPLFVELGWAPLILREDTSRSDLPNTKGETEGLFVGSRTVAWMVTFGGAVPLTSDVDLTLELQYRIRYLVSRGGEPLADEEELGNMMLTPAVGIAHRF